MSRELASFLEEAEKYAQAFREFVEANESAITQGVLGIVAGRAVDVGLYSIGLGFLTGGWFWAILGGVALIRGVALDAERNRINRWRREIQEAERRLMQNGADVAAMLTRRNDVEGLRVLGRVMIPSLA